ncbi:hypothetical protein A0H81_04750 [Grifola frondosa]|uniref:Uncharacterized protein n=1 Tax=Grifola frondosa TaxID=5627 RepID=A0A1C7MGG8_GRIFR|nr:hypothetical protein A0H81_04750 [Grifola frondosa]
MAGLRMSVVVSATAFLLGLLFTHWIADSLTLWKSPETQTDPRLWTRTAGGVTILWSLRDGRAGNLMFDGGSIFLYLTAIAVYIYSVLPNLFANFSSLPLPFTSTHDGLLPFPSTLKEPTLDLASSHLVCSVVLTGVLALQAGRWWAEQADVDEDDQVDGEMHGERDEDTEDPEQEKEKARAGKRRREKSPVEETKKLK